MKWKVLRIIKNFHSFFLFLFLLLTFTLIPSPISPPLCSIIKPSETVAVTATFLHLVYLDLDTKTAEQSTTKLNKKERKKKLPQTFFFSTAAVILNYFLWPFAIIKSSFEPFVYSARLFLLLIDFLLHIMGIQIRIKAEKRDDAVNVCEIVRDWF